MAAHVPRRRCIGCGRIAPKPELVRIAAVPAPGEDRPVAKLDRSGTLPGRGAYVCRVAHGQSVSRGCMTLASRRGALQRAFRRTVEVPVELVESDDR